MAYLQSETGRNLLACTVMVVVRSCHLFSLVVFIQDGLPCFCPYSCRRDDVALPALMSHTMSKVTISVCYRLCYDCHKKKKDAGDDWKSWNAPVSFVPPSPNDHAMTEKKCSPPPFLSPARRITCTVGRTLLPCCFTIVR